MVKEHNEPTADNMLLLGKVTGVYGVKGWVKVFSYTEPRDGILNYKHCFLKRNEQWQATEFSDGRMQGKGVIVKLDGCDDRDQALLLMGTEIAITDDQLDDLAEHEYYWRDLIGLTVINQADIELGVVEGLMETGANDVLIVKGERERLIPFTQGVSVLEVNLEQKMIKVDWDPEF